MSWLVGFDLTSKEGIQGFPFECRGQIRSNDRIPRTGMGIILLPLLPHGTSTLLTPLFPGIIFLISTCACLFDLNRGCYYGFGHLDVNLFQSGHLWESVDKEALYGLQVVEDLGFLVW